MQKNSAKPVSFDHMLNARRFNGYVYQEENVQGDRSIKDYVADKTNWRKMLKNDIEDVSLMEWRDRLKEFIPEEAKEYFIEDNVETHLNFPVKKYPLKPKSLNLIKTPKYTGKLVGIKGQYLIFEDETVFNVRSNEGLVVSIEI